MRFCGGGIIGCRRRRCATGDLPPGDRPRTSRPCGNRSRSSIKCAGCCASRWAVRCGARPRGASAGRHHGRTASSKSVTGSCRVVRAYRPPGLGAVAHLMRTTVQPSGVTRSVSGPAAKMQAMGRQSRHEVVDLLDADILRRQVADQDHDPHHCPATSASPAKARSATPHRRVIRWAI